MLELTEVEISVLCLKMDKTEIFTKLAATALEREQVLKSMQEKESKDAPKQEDVPVGVVNGNKKGFSLMARGAFGRRLFSRKNNEDACGLGESDGALGFASQIRTLAQSISSLKEFLEKNRSEYLSLSVSLLAKYPSSSYSELDRDRIDEQAEGLIRLCNQLLGDLRETMRRIKKSPASNLASFENELLDFTSEKLCQDFHLDENSEHRSLVLDFLEEYLKKVCDIYSQQKAVRLKTSVERKKLAKLESSAKKKTFEHRSTKPINGIDGSSVEFVDHSKSPSVAAVELSPEEQQQLELENQQLLNDLQDMDDQVKVIEGQVVEISRLQSIFTDKVLTQSDKIASVHMTAVTSTENVKQGNESIRDAMRNNAGLRFWILFFLVVSSFSLLFLDWYDT